MHIAIWKQQGQDNEYLDRNGVRVSSFKEHLSMVTFLDKEDLEKRLFRAKLQYEQIERDGKREGENDEEFEMRKFDARRTYEKLQKEYDNKNKDVTNPRGSRIEPEDSDDSTGPVSPEAVADDESSKRIS